MGGGWCKGVLKYIEEEDEVLESGLNFVNNIRDKALSWKSHVVGSLIREGMIRNSS